MRKRSKRDFIAGLVLIALVTASVFAGAPFNIAAPNNGTVYGVAERAPLYNSDYNNLPGNGVYPREYIEKGVDYFDFAFVDQRLGPPVSVTDINNPYSSFNSQFIPEFQNKPILINDKYDLYNLSYRMDGRNTAAGLGLGRNAAASSFYRSAWYILADNIEYSMAANEGIVTFGSQTEPFSGIFDGQGFNIEGLFLEARASRVTLNLSGERYFALFNNNSGIIRNLGIVKPTIDTFSYSGEEEQAAVAYAAGLCGLNTGTIQYCFVDNAGYMIRSFRAAGICGSNRGTLDNVYFAGALAANDASGGTIVQPVALSTDSAITNAWYDNTLFQGAVNPNSGTGLARETLKAKTAGLTDDQWYYNNIAPYNTLYDGYPRLAGVASVASVYRLKRPADLVYLSRLLNSSITSFAPASAIELQADINMSLVSDTAYKSPPTKFQGTIGHETEVYSIINLRILETKVEGSRILSGMLSGYITGNVTVRNVTFVGGFVRQPVYESAGGTVSQNKIFYTGMAVAYAAGPVTLANVNSSAEIIIEERYADGKYTNIGQGMYAGGLIGYAALSTAAHSLTGVSFTGNIDAGTHTTYNTATSTTNSGVGGIAGFYGGGSATLASVSDVTVFGDSVCGPQIIRKDSGYASESTANVYVGGLFGDMSGAFAAVDNIRYDGEVYSSRWKNTADNILENGSAVTISANEQIGTNTGYVGGLMGRGPGSITPSAIAFTGTVYAIENTGAVNAPSGATANTLARTLYAGGIMGISQGAANYGTSITAIGKVVTVNGQSAAQRLNRTALYIGGIVSSSSSDIISASVTGTNALLNYYPAGALGLTSYSNNLICYSPMGSVALSGYTMDRDVTVSSPEAADVYAGGITAYGNSENCTFSAGRTLKVTSEKGGTMYLGGIGLSGTASGCAFMGEILAVNGGTDATPPATRPAMGAMYIGGVKLNGACTSSEMSGTINAYHYATTNGMYVSGFTNNFTNFANSAACASSEMSGTINAHNYASSSGPMYVSGFSYTISTTAGAGAVSGIMSGTINAYNHAASGAAYVSGFNYNNGATTYATATASGTMSGAVNAYNYNTSGTGTMYVSGFTGSSQTNTNYSAATAVLPGSVLSGSVSAVNDSDSGALRVAGFSYHGNVTEASIAPSGSITAVNNSVSGATTASGFSYSGAVNTCTISPAATGFLSAAHTSSGSLNVHGFSYSGAVSYCELSVPLNVANGSSSSSGTYVTGFNYGAGAVSYCTLPVTVEASCSSGTLSVHGFSYSGAVSNCSITATGKVKAVNNSSSGTMTVTGFSYSGAVSACMVDPAATGFLDATNVSSSGNMYVHGFSCTGAVSSCTLPVSLSITNGSSDSSSLYVTGFNFGSGAVTNCTLSGDVTATQNTGGSLYVSGFSYSGAVSGATTMSTSVTANNNGSAGATNTAGFTYSGAVTSCLMSGTVTAKNTAANTGAMNVGGLTVSGTINASCRASGVIDVYNYGSSVITAGGLSSTGSATGGSSPANPFSVFSGTLNIFNNAGTTVNAGGFNAGGGTVGSSSYNIQACPIFEGTINYNPASADFTYGAVNMDALCLTGVSRTGIVYNTLSRGAINVGHAGLTISTTNFYISGIAYAPSAITNCVNRTVFNFAGTISARSTSSFLAVGGISVGGSGTHNKNANYADINIGAGVFTGAAATLRVGGITASATNSSNGSVDNFYINNALNAGNITVNTSMTVHAGGIVGYGNTASNYHQGMSNCVNRGNVTLQSASAGANSCAGGLAGSYGGAYTGYVTYIANSANFGNVTSLNASGTVSAGGIIGRVVSVQIMLTGCVNSGSVTQAGTAYTNYNGGLIGYTNSTGSSYTVPYATVNNCLNYGYVGAGQYSGGLIGYNHHSSASIQNLKINDSINHGDVGLGATGKYSGGIIGYVSSTPVLTRVINFGAVQTGTGGTSGGLIGHRATSAIAQYALYVYAQSGALSVSGAGATGGTFEHVYTTYNGGDTSMGTVSYAPADNGDYGTYYGIYNVKFAFYADEWREWGIAMTDRPNQNGPIITHAWQGYDSENERLNYYSYAVSSPMNSTGTGSVLSETPENRKWGNYLTDNILNTFNDLALNIADYPASGTPGAGLRYLPAADIARATQIVSDTGETISRDCEIIDLNLKVEEGTGTPGLKVTPKVWNTYDYKCVYGGTDEGIKEYEDLDATVFNTELSNSIPKPNDFNEGDKFGYIYFYLAHTELTDYSDLPAYLYFVQNAVTLSQKAVILGSWHIAVEAGEGYHAAYILLKVEQREGENPYAHKYWLIELEFSHPALKVTPVSLPEYALAINGTSLAPTQYQTLAQKPAYAPSALPEGIYLVVDTLPVPDAAFPVDYTNGTLRVSFDTQGFPGGTDAQGGTNFRTASNLMLYGSDGAQMPLTLTGSSTANAYFNPSSPTNNGIITGITDPINMYGKLFFQFVFPQSVPAGVYYLVLYFGEDVQNEDILYVVQFVKAPRPPNTGADISTVTVKGGNSLYNALYTANSVSAANASIGFPNYNYGDYFVLNALNANWSQLSMPDRLSPGDTYTYWSMAADAGGFFTALTLSAASQYATIHFPHRIDFETFVPASPKYYQSYNSAGVPTNVRVDFNLTRIKIYFRVTAEDGVTFKDWTLTLEENAPEINAVSSVLKNGQAAAYPLTVERKEEAAFRFTLSNSNSYMLSHLGSDFTHKAVPPETGDILPETSRSAQVYTVSFGLQTATGVYYVRPYIEANTVDNLEFSFPFTVEINESAAGNEGFSGYLYQGYGRTHNYSWEEVTLAEFSIEKLKSKDSYATGMFFDLAPNGVSLSPGDWVWTGPQTGNFIPYTGASYDPADPNRVTTITVTATYTNDEFSFGNRVSLDLPDFGSLYVYYPDTETGVLVKWYDKASGEWVDNTFIIPENITVRFRVYAEDGVNWTDYMIRLGEGRANKRISITARVPVDFDGYLIITLYTVIDNIEQGQTTYRMTRFTMVVFVNNDPTKYTIRQDAEGNDYKESIYRLANHIPALYSIEVRTVTGYDIFYEAGADSLVVDENGDWVPDVYGRPYLDLKDEAEQWSDLIITLKNNGQDDPWGFYYEDWYER